MPNLNVYTVITSDATPTLYHTTYYLNENLGSFILAFIVGQGITNVSGVPVQQGYGIIQEDDTFVDFVTPSLDPSGNLLVTGEAVEAAKYALDSNGELTYTTTV